MKKISSYDHIYITFRQTIFLFSSGNYFLIKRNLRRENKVKWLSHAMAQGISIGLTPCAWHFYRSGISIGLTPCASLNRVHKVIVFQQKSESPTVMN